MQSLYELYKIGNGPSSSHTMGPKRAVDKFIKTYSNIESLKVILYGSLALTGKGHLTDYIIKQTAGDIKIEIVFDLKKECNVHPNTMEIIGYDKEKNIIDNWTVYSVGGGTILVDGENSSDLPEVYTLNKFEDIKLYCKKNNLKLHEYVYNVEGYNITEYLKEVWQAMKDAVERGLNAKGNIPGRLRLSRSALNVYNTIVENEDDSLRQTRLLSSYAIAVSEENASGGKIVTAPTCGASGVLPAVLYYYNHEKDIPEYTIIEALAVAGLIGNIIKTNASISGAECGCQAEIGTACSMAAGAVAYIMGLDIDRIENSAEVAMEHHLGLTCDPIYGYVQIPCIERNAVAAIRAVDSAKLSMLMRKNKSISLDVVVDTMYETGKDLHSHYRETSEGGLAKKYCRNKYYNKELS
ncbi:MAG: L-serine ammonia-lyase [Clostridia bacterium]|nr:L-serine ammonia-lyase [Clostridia bacterium]